MSGYVYLSPVVELGAPKIDIAPPLSRVELGAHKIWLKYYTQITFNLKKGLKLKLFRIHFLQKLSGRICLSTAGVEVGASNI